MSTDQKITTAEAVIELQKGLRVFRAFEHALRAVEVIAGLEQRERELKSAITQLQQEHSTLAAEVPALKAANKLTVEKARAQAEQIVEKAEASAGNILVNAENKAAEMLSMAQKAEAEIVERSNKVKAESDVLAVQIKAGRAELADIEGRIGKAKATVQKLLG